MGIVKAKVLIVDDEVAISETISLFLEDYNILHEIASSGEQAIEILEKEKIDVAIVDVRLPGMSGTEFIKSVYYKYPHMYFVLLTGSMDINLSEVLCLERVSKKVFYKPIPDTLDLIKEIILLINKKEHE